MPQDTFFACVAMRCANQFQACFYDSVLLVSDAGVPPFAPLRGEPGTGDGCPSGTAQRRIRLIKYSSCLEGG